MAAPQLLSRKPNGAANQASGDTSRAPKRRATVEGEKVVVRRLPPGMTEDEFVAILGDTWKVGKGKVSWISYYPGKVSQHPSRPSRPSRCYLNVTKKDDLLALAHTVQTAVWEDTKETYNDPALVLPPAFDFSIYKKVPSDKKRTDSRQGTIDQDPEFMAFLEGLANPDAHKDGEADGADEDGTKEKTTTTPLIEYLREKKAAKVKEAAAARSARHSRQDSQGGKGDATPSSAESSKRKGKELRESKPERSSDRPRESVKILTKKAATDAAAEAAKAVASQIQSTPSSSAQEPLPKSRRAGIAAAARILQRDLGLSPGNAHRKARQEAAKAEQDAKASSSKEPAKEPTPAPKEVPVTPVAPVESPSAPTPPKASSSSGRTRNRKRGGAEDSAKGKGESKGEKAPEPTPQVQALTKGPIILLKKKDKEQATPAASSSSSSTQPTPSQPENVSKAAPPPASKSTATPPPANEGKPTPAKPISSGKKASTKSDPIPSPSSGSTKAFIKRANPSQGVTDSTLREVMQAFGAVTAVEMDRKKGFAYVDFADHESLVKAMAASPVTIAQASVQVVERKDMGKKAQGGGGKSSAVASSSNNTGSSSAAAAAGEVSGSGSQPAQISAPASGLKAPATGTPTPTDKAGGEKRSGRRRGGRGKDKEPAVQGSKEGSGGGKNAFGADSGAGTSSAAGQSSK